MKEKRRGPVILSLLSVLLLTTILSLTVYGGVPQQMNYQGCLTDPSGTPVADGSYIMSFSIYDAAGGGTALWSESQTLTVTDGIYNVILGQSGNELNPNHFDGNRYLGVTVGSDSEMTPRQLLTCSPFAMKAAVADSVGDGVIETIHLANDAVTGDKIHDGAVLSSHIQDGATLSEILDDDGAGSGLDSDLLDGQESTYYRNAGNVNAGTLNNARFSAHADLAAEGYLGNASGDLAQNNGTVQTNLNADRLDGQHANAFSSASHTHDTLYYTESESDSRFVDVTGDTMSGSTSGSVLSVTNAGTGYGGYFSASGTSGFGVYGNASGTTGFGVYGSATGASGHGVYGLATGVSGAAVTGYAPDSGTGNNYGGYFGANGASGRGVYGFATGYYGYGGYFTASGTNGHGVHGSATGVYGHGVHGSASNTGNVTNYGGFFEAAGTYGRAVSGEASNTGNATNYGGYFTARGTTGRGVHGSASGTSGVGVYGTASGSSSNGVYGFDSGTSGNGVHGYASGTYGDGVHGYATGYNGYGVYGTATSTGYSCWAGYFSGRVKVTGYFSKGGGGFQIDHPLEPENKYLNHSFVESPDMMNMYNGNVVLNHKGEAWVDLPEWFETLNKDFRYQLTPVGAPGPNLYIAQKIADNRFKIAGGKPEMEVSWQVTGIRQDPWANANRLPVEEDKTDKELGYYLHPEPYGQPEEKGIEWARDPEGMQRMKEEREKQEESTS